MPTVGESSDQLSTSPPRPLRKESSSNPSHEGDSQMEGENAATYEMSENAEAMNDVNDDGRDATSPRRVCFRFVCLYFYTLFVVLFFLLFISNVTYLLIGSTK